MRLKHSYSITSRLLIRSVCNLTCKPTVPLPSIPVTFVSKPVKNYSNTCRHITGIRHQSRFIPVGCLVPSHLSAEKNLSTFGYQIKRSVFLSMATTNADTTVVSPEKLISTESDKKEDGTVTDGTGLETSSKDTFSCQQNSMKATQGDTPQLSKRAQKKLLRREKSKELRKAKRAPNFTKNSNPGFNIDIFQETDYYFENGLRKVYPYPFTFSTYAKERWYGRSIQDIFENEFRVDSPDNFRTSVKKGYMQVNGAVVGLDYVLKNGDLIEHHIHRHENPVSGTPIEIIEDTPELVVINKPSSIPCHPCGKFRFNSIVFIMGKEFGYANLRNIYRLDRLTSGVLILGKTAKKTKELENQILHRHVQKEYVARVMGEFPEGEIVSDQPLGCLSHKLTLWQVQAGGKASRTTFKRISYNGKTSVVKCMPHTGRTHQIRVHLQYLGHPIVNDPFYNSPSWGPLRGKGGHCDVSHEELCKRIMKEHNVGMWCDGENPLFTERLSTGASAATPDTTKVLTEDSSTKEGVDGTSSPAASPVPKRLKLSTEATAQTKKNKQETCSISGGGADSHREGASGEPEHSHSFSEATDAASDAATADSVANAVSCTVSEDSSAKLGDGEESQKLDVKAVEHKGFDPERWVPDPLCESCRLKYIDPKPSDLLLYLHASRYQGPTWDYSAKLPAWAEDDWEEPEEYQKYFHTDS